MRLMTSEELLAVAGGEDEIQKVEVKATKRQVEEARWDDFMGNGAGFISAAAGFASGAVVTGGCVLIPSLLSGPAAPETAAVLARPCAYVGGLVGTGVGVATSNYIKSKRKFD